MQLFLEVGLSKECLQNKHSPLFQGIMFPLTKRQIALNGQQKNLCGSSTVQFRSLTPDWLMNLKLGGNTAIRSTLWSSEVTQFHFLKTILAYPNLMLSEEEH